MKTKLNYICIAFNQLMLQTQQNIENKIQSAICACCCICCCMAQAI